MHIAFRTRQYVM